MKDLLFSFKFLLNDKIYIKDPDSSELGQKIVENSIILIAQNGFESFNFKKLGEVIQSNESSIYRYFENKHKLLVYLCSWYWSWIEYELVINTSNVDNPLEKLKKAVMVVTQKNEYLQSNGHVNIDMLYKIVVEEFVKTLYTREVDEENKYGYFSIYKRVINRLVDMVVQVNPSYPYPQSLVSSVVQGALHQHFLMGHLKTITSCNENVQPSEFYVHLIEKVIQ